MGLMDTVRAHGRARTADDRNMQDEGATNVRSTNRHESLSEEESNSSHFVLRKDTEPRVPVSESKPTQEAGGDISAVRSTNRYESLDAVAQLMTWRAARLLDTLPEIVPGFEGELARYADRDEMIRMVGLVIGSARWSLTARERAEQFVTALAPLLVSTPSTAR